MTAPTRVPCSYPECGGGCAGCQPEPQQTPRPSWVDGGAGLNGAEGSADADRWNAVVLLAHQLDDAAQHITERQAYDFATQFRVLAGIDGEQAAANAAAALTPPAPNQGEAS